MNMEKIEGGYIAYEKAMRDIARLIDAELQKRIGRMGFALLVFEFGAPGLGNYISNVNRADMITSLKEIIGRLERHEDMPAAHPTEQ